MRIAVLYTLFAGIATAANLGVQALVVAVLHHGGAAVPLSVLAGTIVGLPVKYLLDKRYIFGPASTGDRRDAAAFTLYTGTAVVTTLVFWGCEALGGVASGGNDAARLGGGAVGLAIGYAMKYRLDKRYVFNHMTVSGGRVR